MLSTGRERWQRGRVNALSRIRLGAFALLYGCGAREFDRFTGWLFLGEWARWQEAVLPFLPPSGRIVELGSGTGRLAAISSRPGREWLAIEPSAAMIAAARANNRSQRYMLIRGLAGHIPLDDGTADAIVSVFPAPFIFDPRTAREIKRVVKPDGTVVVALGAELAAHGPWRRFRRLALRLFYGTGKSRPTTEFHLPGVSGIYHQVATTHGTVNVFVGKPVEIAKIASERESADHCDHEVADPDFGNRTDRGNSSL